MFSIIELFEIAITIIALGYIFSDYLKKSKIEFYKHDLDSIFKAAIIVSPSIILHELAHKFTAIYFGANAIFHANFYGLLLGIAMKTMNLPIIFIPAYVSVTGLNVIPIKYGLIAISGPLVNLSIFLILSLITKYFELKEETYSYLIVIKEMNKLLFLFNMLPIPGTDGFNFYHAILSSI
jgi:Zn-dependent protease